ncbi:uncharacterized protein involved in cysteine biosynthesis [Bartonella fuyuanensis]|uniref:Uncharacterized protein involved in cysteine biosynthesis n=1 Tax=Bartonella fuyuanensis TaxID=1460968 RepID=A0A840DZA7_9HYPH|nr:uncharacterized protein involved in cysteine biosynthesis [Bartonella fuyuanensis]
MSYLGPWIAQFIPEFPNWTGWLGFSMLIILNIGVALLLAFLIAPITAMIGSFLIDSAVEIIEKENYPNWQIGQALSFKRLLIISF